MSLIDCAVDIGERVTCGQAGIKPTDCENMGCCVDPNNYACYYPLDGKIVFIFKLHLKKKKNP